MHWGKLGKRRLDFIQVYFNLCQSGAWPRRFLCQFEVKIKQNYLKYGDLAPLNNFYLDPILKKAFLFVSSIWFFTSAWCKKRECKSYSKFYFSLENDWNSIFLILWLYSFFFFFFFHPFYLVSKDGFTRTKRMINRTKKKDCLAI